MDELILARHGESTFSAVGRMNGDRGVPVRLTDRGREEARELGRALAPVRIDLCVTSEFERVQETADLALAGRDVPRLVLPELNEIYVGSFEGGPFDEYREWAGSHGPDDAGPGGAESRASALRRFVRGYRILLARPERTVLLVAHGLVIRYLLNALDEIDPMPFLEGVPHAQAASFPAAEIRVAVERLEAWLVAPAWS